MDGGEAGQGTRMDRVEIRHRVREALNDVDFPAMKDELVRAAETSGDEGAVRAVRGLPLAEYANYDEVLRSISTPGG